MCAFVSVCFCVCVCLCVWEGVEIYWNCWVIFIVKLVNLTFSEKLKRFWQRHSFFQKQGYELLLFGYKNNLKWKNVTFKLAWIHNHYKQFCLTNNHIKSICFNILIDIFGAVVHQIFLPSEECVLPYIVCFCLKLLGRSLNRMENIYFSKFCNFREGGMLIIWNESENFT